MSKPNSDPPPFPPCYSLYPLSIRLPFLLPPSSPPVIPPFSFLFTPHYIAIPLSSCLSSVPLFSTSTSSFLHLFSVLNLLEMFPTTFSFLISILLSIPQHWSLNMVHWWAPIDVHYRRPVGDSFCEAVHTTAPRYVTDFPSHSPSINLPLSHSLSSPLLVLSPSPQPPFLSTKHLTFQKCSDDPFLLSWHLAKSFTNFSVVITHTHTHHTHTHTQFLYHAPEDYFSSHAPSPTPS